MYDDHLEIVSSGGFHFGIEPAKLAVPHGSKLCNPIIAIVFTALASSNVGAWGREFYCPVPEWKEQTDNVSVTSKPTAWLNQTMPSPQV